MDRAVLIEPPFTAALELGADDDDGDSDEFSSCAIEKVGGFRPGRNGKNDPVKQERGLGILGGDLDSC